jgi:predicted permease
MFSDDVLLAWRRIRSKPGLMLAAAAMLALGIGLTTAMFTIADTLLLRPVPFREPAKLVQVYMGSERGGRWAVSRDVFHAWRSSPAFESVESVSRGTALIAAADGPVARRSAFVTPGLFRMLGVRPIRGRVFEPEEGRAGADDRVLLSEDVWRSTFASDPSIVGKTIDVNHRSLVVVGIMPADFRFPSFDTVVWQPANFDTPPPDRATELPTPFARVASGVPDADVRRMATEAAHAADPSTTRLFARLDPLTGLRQDRYNQRALPLLFGGVGLVFLVLCANVSSLLLVRLTERRREFSTCSALGASRGRLLRQTLIESVLLGAAGSAAGVALSWVLVAAAREFLPEAFLLRTLNPLNVDVRALLAASAAGALATVVAGVWPAWVGTRLDAADAMRGGDRSGTESRAARSITRALLVGEIALACALLVGAALLVRSFINLSDTDRGLDSHGVLVATINLPSSAFKDRASRQAITAAIEEEMRRLPGIRQVALSFGLPPDGGGIHFTFKWRTSVPGAEPVEIAAVESYHVGADFFDLYRIPLLRGRTFQPSDTDHDAIIGERLASRLFPGVDPIGATFGFGKEDLRIVGVAREINHPSIDPRVDRPEFYQALPAASLGGLIMMSLRCSDPCPGAAVIRQRLMATSPAVDVINVGPLDDEYFAQLAAPRAAAALGFVFATIGVIAASGGLFGILSYAVGRRRREFGIRAALGASERQIRRLVFREGLLVVTAGILLGSVAGWSFARSLSSLQYGVSVFDPAIWLAVIGLLAVTTLAAALRPAQVAGRVDPVTLLRDE